MGRRRAPWRDRAAFYRGARPPALNTFSSGVFADGPGKAEGINHYIGRQPIFAFGNSIGDKEMLEWTANCKGLCFMGLVHHDDAEREYAYGPDSDVGRFRIELAEHAKANGWNVVSMKDDWKVIFSWGKTSP